MTKPKSKVETAYLRGLAHAAWPSIWAHDVLDWKADKEQTVFLNTAASDILINCCRQWGKTQGAAIKAAHRARFMAESEILVVSATQRQAGILQKWASWALTKSIQAFELKFGKEYEVLEYDPDDGPQIIKRSVLSLELSNKSVIISTPASEDSIRGYSPSMIIVDEDSRVSDALYDALRPMRAAHPCQLVLQSTPNGKRGHFYRECTGNDETWFRITVPADHCPRITSEFLARERLKMTSEDMFQQEYFCKFIEAEGSLFTEEMIAAMTIIDADIDRIAKPWLPEDMNA